MFGDNLVKVVETTTFGQIVTRVHHYLDKGNGVYILHRTNGPATIEKSRDGNVFLNEEYYVNGKRHRVGNNPAIIRKYADGTISQVCYCINNHIHRNEDKPALLWFHPNGNIQSESWYIKGSLTRINDAAQISYFNDGRTISSKYYMRNGKTHRTNGPAKLTYFKNGNLEEESFYENGLYHNLNGPAHIKYDINGKVELEYYYIKNNFYKDKKGWEAAKIVYNKSSKPMPHIYINVNLQLKDPDGCICRKCGSFEKYVASDGPDGKVTCWGCK